VAALGLGIGLLKIHLVAAADVALEGERQIAPQQAEGEGVALHLAARLLQLGVVVGDGRRPGLIGAQGMQQAGASRLPRSRHCTPPSG
jgi:hypothetical protein